MWVKKIIRDNRGMTKSNKGGEFNDNNVPKSVVLFQSSSVLKKSTGTVRQSEKRSAGPRYDRWSWFEILVWYSSRQRGSSTRGLKTEQ